MYLYILISSSVAVDFFQISNPFVEAYRHGHANPTATWTEQVARYVAATIHFTSLHGASVSFTRACAPNICINTTCSTCTTYFISVNDESGKKQKKTDPNVRVNFVTFSRHSYNVRPTSFSLAHSNESKSFPPVVFPSRLVPG